MRLQIQLSFALVCLLTVPCLGEQRHINTYYGSRFNRLNSNFGIRTSTEYRVLTQHSVNRPDVSPCGKSYHNGLTALPAAGSSTRVDFQPDLPYMAHDGTRQVFWLNSSLVRNLHDSGRIILGKSSPCQYFTGDVLRTARRRCYETLREARQKLAKVHPLEEGPADLARLTEDTRERISTIKNIYNNTILFHIECPCDGDIILIRGASAAKIGLTQRCHSFRHAVLRAIDAFAIGIYNFVELPSEWMRNAGKTIIIDGYEVEVRHILNFGFVDKKRHYLFYGSDAMRQPCPREIGEASHQIGFNIHLNTESTFCIYYDDHDRDSERFYCEKDLIATVFNEMANFLISDCEIPGLASMRHDVDTSILDERSVNQMLITWQTEKTQRFCKNETGDPPATTAHSDGARREEETTLTNFDTTYNMDGTDLQLNTESSQTTGTSSTAAITIEDSNNENGDNESKQANAGQNTNHTTTSSPVAETTNEKLTWATEKEDYVTTQEPVASNTSLAEETTNGNATSSDDKDGPENTPTDKSHVDGETTEENSSDTGATTEAEEQATISATDASVFEEENTEAEGGNFHTTAAIPTQELTTSVSSASSPETNANENSASTEANVEDEKSVEEGSAATTSAESGQATESTTNRRVKKANGKTSYDDDGDVEGSTAVYEEPNPAADFVDPIDSAEMLRIAHLWAKCIQLAREVM